MVIDRRWLVENRSKIQTCMLDLDDFGAALQSQKSEHWAVYTTLVGIVFSLWRAVFLIQRDWTLKTHRKHARELLGILIETNIIGFPQDQRTAQWTAGFYLENA